MDILTKAATIIGKGFWKHKRAEAFKSDLVGALIDWVEPLFLTSEPELKEALAEGPASPETEGKLEEHLKAYAEQHPEFLKALEEKLRPITRKNVAELDSATNIVEGDVQIGDEGSTDQGVDEKNVLRTSGEKTEIKGGLRIGDRKKE
ncbi:MAG: hypothetical protein AAF798_14705 [Bacteroidota bacterium]